MSSFEDAMAHVDTEAVAKLTMEMVDIPSAMGCEKELALYLEAALRTLPAEQRSALVLVDMYGWPVDEAAEVLDCAPGTVKSRCSRGRARLVALLRDPSPPTGNHAAPDRVPPVTERSAAPEGGDRT